MFQFLQAPFENDVTTVIKKVTYRTVHAAIIWRSSKGLRLIIASSASVERQSYRNSKMQAWLEMLNSESLTNVKKALREIFHENTPRPRPKPFYPSFKGYGGYGVDAWD